MSPESSSVAAAGSLASSHVQGQRGRKGGHSRKMANIRTRDHHDCRRKRQGAGTPGPSGPGPQPVGSQPIICSTGVGVLCLTSPVQECLILKALPVLQSAKVTRVCLQFFVFSDSYSAGLTDAKLNHSGSSAPPVQPAGSLPAAPGEDVLLGAQPFLLDWQASGDQGLLHLTTCF